jgi:hypothetical protein
MSRRQPGGDPPRSVRDLKLRRRVLLPRRANVGQRHQRPPVALCGQAPLPPVERDGDAPYSYAQLLRMNQRFVEQVERAIARGLERPCDEPHKSHTLGIIRIAGRESGSSPSS